MPRTKGAKGKHTFQVEELAQKFKREPFEILMMIAEGDWKGLGYDSEVLFSESGEGEGGRAFMRYTITPEMRMKAAEGACKFLYSTKQATTVSAPEGIKLIIEDYTKK